MAHTDRCARAKRPRCRCKCGGARHGCQGGFEIADGPEDAVLAYMEQQDENWRRPPPKMTDGQAALGCSRADVVHWLHRDRILREHSRTTEEVAFEDVPGAQGRGLVLRDLSERLGPELMGKFQTWAARTHFWCELLAQFAYAITRYQQLKGLIPSAVEKTLAARKTAPPPEGPDGSEIMGIAVHATWRYVLEAMAVVSGIPPVPLLESGETILWPIRVIAVLMCPDASRHEAVREHCWAPILRHGEASVRQEVRDRLAQVFPGDRWFTQFETPSPAPAAGI